MSIFLIKVKAEHLLLGVREQDGLTEATPVMFWGYSCCAQERPGSTQGTTCSSVMEAGWPQAGKHLTYYLFVLQDSDPTAAPVPF